MTDDDKDKNPNALTYGISPSAPASIKPVDIDKWKAVVAPTFKLLSDGQASLFVLFKRLGFITGTW